MHAQRATQRTPDVRGAMICAAAVAEAAKENHEEQSSDEASTLPTDLALRIIGSCHDAADLFQMTAVCRAWRVLLLFFTSP